MTTLSIHPYPTERAAERKVQLLDRGQGRRLAVDDAAVISWPADADRPLAWQTCPLGARRPLTGAFWGLLFAHLFLIPLSYAEPPRLPADGADASLDPLGFTGPRLAAIRSLLGPGTSAILALHTDDACDTLAELLGGDPGRLTEIVLDPLQSRRLLAGFGDEAR